MEKIGNKKIAQNSFFQNEWKGQNFFPHDWKLEKLSLLFLPQLKLVCFRFIEFPVLAHSSQPDRHINKNEKT